MEITHTRREDSHDDLLEIDGSVGEGGGQILRSSLTLSLVTGKAFRISNIRAGRKKPGLLHQHLTSVNAAAQVGSARVRGDRLGSREIYFGPQGIRPGHYEFSVGTAGSCTLVLQTILPALLTAESESQLSLEGGTHNPFAPPFEFLARSFLPLVKRMGPSVKALLRRPGFYPAGGGSIDVSITPVPALSRLVLLDRGGIRNMRAHALVARLPRRIAEREIQVLRDSLALRRENTEVAEIADSRGPGNVVIVEIESEHVTEVFTGFGQRGVRAEQVAEKIVSEVTEYLAADMPVGRRLADQLLIPMAIAGGGRFRTLSPSNHTRTNIGVIRRFLDVDISVHQCDNRVWEVVIEATEG